MRSLAWKPRRKVSRALASQASEAPAAGPSSFLAIPPPTWSPPTARVRSAQFPASAPYISRKRSTAREQVSLRPSMAAVEIAAAGSPSRSAVESQAGSSPPPDSRRYSWTFTSPGPESTRSTLTWPCRARRKASNPASSGLRAAKSACPPSLAMETRVVPDRISAENPMPVPAAMTATVPSAGAPSCSVRLA